jgi:NAD(P)-dependent dehydrogenase (short-subunit alcohol dehydrogenase family)
MKVLIIGASGAIGKVITPAIQRNHEVVTAGRNSGDIAVDISSAVSIEGLFQKVANLDAVICVAGDSVTTGLHSMNEEKYKAGIQQKLLAQINLVLTGINYLNKNGSFTLISGKMGERPAPGSSGKAIMNAAVNSFVLSASLEMPKGMRLNVVSPSKISDIPDKDIVAAYLTCIETNVNGEIIRIGY